MARDRRAEFERRDARARDLGYRSYRDQRNQRAKAVDALPAQYGGNDRKAVAARDIWGVLSREPASLDRVKAGAKAALAAGLSPRKLIGLLPY